MADYNRHLPRMQGDGFPILDGQSDVMSDPAQARAYLLAIVLEMKVPMSRLSTAIGRGESYIQQYIRYGKPMWLDARDVEGLQTVIPGLDGGRLRPPPLAIQATDLLHRTSGSPDQREQRQVNAPQYRQIIQESGALELLQLWLGLTAEKREIAIRLLRSLRE